MFVIKNPDHVCCVCLDVYHQPQILPCEHNLCLECAQRLLGQSCPLCRAPVATFHRNVLLEFEIISAEVHCKHKRYGCNLYPNLLTYEEHALECEYRPFKCPNGCGFEAPSLDGHTAQDCFVGFHALLDASSTKLHLSESVAEHRRLEVQELMANNDILVLEYELARHDHVSAQQQVDYLIEENLDLEDSVADLEEENLSLEEENRRLLVETGRLEEENGRLEVRIDHLVSVANELRVGFTRGQQIISRKY